jgi:hypothetical protein
VVRNLHSVDVKLRMISYWARLLTGKETKLSYLSYKILYNLFIDENLDFSWIKHVKHIFDDTGYSYIWSQQFLQNSDLLIALIRNRLQAGIQLTSYVFYLFSKLQTLLL